MSDFTSPTSHSSCLPHSRGTPVQAHSTALKSLLLVVPSAGFLCCYSQSSLLADARAIDCPRELPNSKTCFTRTHMHTSNTLNGSLEPSLICPHSNQSYLLSLTILLHINAPASLSTGNCPIFPTSWLGTCRSFGLENPFPKSCHLSRTRSKAASSMNLSPGPPIRSNLSVL